MKLQQTEEQHNFWDIVTKLFGAVGFIATAAIGVSQFNATQASELAKQRVELNAEVESAQRLRKQELEKPLNDMRLKLYTEAVATLAVVAERKEDSDEWKKAYARLKVLHWAELPLIESDDFKAQMHDAMRSILKFKNDKRIDVAEADALNKMAIKLSATARQDLRFGFNDLLREKKATASDASSVASGR